jgi:hypothetical protein
MSICDLVPANLPHAVFNANRCREGPVFVSIGDSPQSVAILNDDTEVSGAEIESDLEELVYRNQ